MDWPRKWASRYKLSIASTRFVPSRRHPCRHAGNLDFQIKSQISMGLQTTVRLGLPGFVWSSSCLPCRMKIVVRPSQVSVRLSSSFKPSVKAVKAVNYGPNRSIEVAPNTLNFLKMKQIIPCPYKIPLPSERVSNPET